MKPTAESGVVFDSVAELRVVHLGLELIKGLTDPDSELERQIETMQAECNGAIESTGEVIQDRLTEQDRTVGAHLVFEQNGGVEIAMLAVSALASATPGTPTHAMIENDLAQPVATKMLDEYARARSQAATPSPPLLMSLL